MRQRLDRSIVLLALAAAALAGCTVGPSFRPSSPQISTTWSSSAAPLTAGQASQVTTAPAGGFGAKNSPWPNQNWPLKRSW